MNESNPYAPPESEVAARSVGVSSSEEEIVARFIFNSDYLLETLARFRDVRSRRWLKWLRYLLVALILVPTISSLTDGAYRQAAFLLVAIGALLFTKQIQAFFAKRSFRKSPYYNVEHVLRFSAAGLETQSPIEKTEVKWNIFTEAVIFNDGVLMFRGPHVVNWVADSALTGTNDTNRLRDLVKQHVQTN